MITQTSSSGEHLLPNPLAAAALRGRCYAKTLQALLRSQRVLVLAAAAASCGTSPTAQAFTGSSGAAAPTTNVLIEQLTAGGTTNNSRDFSDNGGPPGQTFTLAPGSYEMNAFTFKGVGQTGAAAFSSVWSLQIGSVDPVTKAITPLSTESGTFSTTTASTDYLTFALETPVALSGNIQYAVSVYSGAGWYGLAHSPGDVYAGGGAFNRGPSAATPGGNRTFTNNAFVNANPGNYDYVFSLQGTTLATIVLRTWSGTVNGLWDTSTANFSGSTFANGNEVQFKDLDANGAEPATRTVTIQPAGVSVNAMTVDNSTGDYTFDGSINASNATSTLTKKGTSMATFSGTGNNAGMNATVLGGTVVLAKTSSATVHAVAGLTLAPETTAVLAGTGGDQIEDIGAIGVNGTLDLNGRTEAVGAFSGAGTVTNNAAGASTLTAGMGDADGDYSGAINNGTGSVSLVKAGAGRLTLRGTSNYTGGTTINGGTLALGTDSGGNQNAGSVGTGAISVNGGGSLRLGGTGGANVVAYTLANGITLNDGTIYAADGLQQLTGGLAVGALGGSLGAQFAGKNLAVNAPITGAGALRVQGAGGTVVFNTSNPGFSGPLTVDVAGILQSSVAGALGSGAVTVDGTLNLNNVSQTIGNLAGGIGAINAGSSNLTVNGGTFSGAFNGATGSVTVGGNLALSGASTLNTQTVRLAAGSILNVSGVTPVDPATVPTPLGAATNLNGIGTVNGPMATIAGNSISPGLNANGIGGSIGTLTTGDLTLATGTTLNFVLGTPGTTNPGTGSFINVMGNLTLNNGINLQFADNANQGGQGSFGNGLYKLLAYSGTLSGFDAGTTFAGPLGHAYTFSSTAPTAGEIRVLVSTAGLSWTGRDGGNGTANSAWNTTAPNWANGATAATYADPAIVTFQDTNTVTNTPINNGNVQVQAGGVTPTNVFFTNHSVTYTLTSSDAIGIAGSGSLVKRGTGMTILAGANTYTGSTQVRTGTLRLGHADAVQNSTVVQDSVLQFAPGVSTFTVGGLDGTAGLALNDTANAPITLRVGNNGASTAYTGVLSGTGGLTKIGAGTLSLSGDSNFTGNLAIDGGTLVANLGKNAVNSTSGALGNANAAGRTIAVNAGGTLNFGAGDVFGTVASGPMAATLIVNQGGTVTNSNNAYNTLGAVQLNGGTIAATGGTSASYPAFQLRGNVTTAGTVTSAISATGGNSAFQLQGGTGNAITFNVGETGQDVDLLVSAPLQDGYAPGALLTKSASGLIKSGAGNMRLTAAATYTGGTIINAGTLTATQSMPGLPAAPANMQIAAGATMEFAAAADIFQGRTAYTGSGTLLKTGIGSLVFSEGLTSVSMSAGSLIDVQGGTIRAGNFNSQDNSFVGNLSSLNIAAGATFDAYATNVVFDQLTGSGTLRGGWFNGSRTITVGANNGSSTFSGAIEGNPATDAFSFAPLVKTGTGTLTLTGALNFSGSYNSNTLTVTGGTTGTPSTLNLNPTAGSLVGYIRTTSGGQGGGQVRFGPTAGDEVVVNQTAGSMFGTTLSIGEAGAAAFNVSGGTVYANAVQLGLNAGSLGTEAAALNVSGTGVVNVLANGSIVMGRNSTRPVTITQTGGTLALYSDTGVPTAPATSPVAPVTKGGTGALSFESASTAATYNLNGGMLSIPRITNTGGGNGILNLNGGKLEITSAAFTVPTGVATNVLEGGAVIDTFGLAVSLNGALTHGGINPVDGGLTLDNVSSAGSLTLTELNTYTGPTIVDDGTLVIAGSLNGTARVDVLAGGTLAGGGSIVLAPGVAGDLNLLADGKLSPGSGVGTLSTTFAGGGELNLVPAVSQSSVGALLFELADVAASDRVALNGGALNIGTGVLAFDDFVFSTLAGFNAGTYTLFDASTPIIGTLDPNTANLSGTVGGLMASLAMADGGNDLILTVVPEPGAIGLLLVGVVGLATRRARKSSRA